MMHRSSNPWRGVDATQLAALAGLKTSSDYSTSANAGDEETESSDSESEDYGSSTTSFTALLDTRAFAEFRPMTPEVTAAAAVAAETSERKLKVSNEWADSQWTATTLDGSSMDVAQLPASLLNNPEELLTDIDSLPSKQLRPILKLLLTQFMQVNGFLEDLKLQIANNNLTVSLDKISGLVGALETERSIVAPGLGSSILEQEAASRLHLARVDTLPLSNPQRVKMPMEGVLPATSLAADAVASALTNANRDIQACLSANDGPSFATPSAEVSFVECEGSSISSTTSERPHCAPPLA